MHCAHLKTHRQDKPLMHNAKRCNLRRSKFLIQQLPTADTFRKEETKRSELRRLQHLKSSVRDKWTRDDSSATGFYRLFLCANRVPIESIESIRRFIDASLALAFIGIELRISLILTLAGIYEQSAELSITYRFVTDI